MPIPLAAMAVGAATPFISNALSKLFGGDAEAAEKAALERAKAQYQRVAEGGTTQGQAGLSYARGRALQELAGQAQRGTAQQRAGLEREAMRTGADVQARYASQLAELRAMEQERARQGVAGVEARESLRAGQEAQRQRQMISGAIAGAATPLVTSLLTPATAAETELARQAESARLVGETPVATAQGISSEQAASALGFTPAQQAGAVSGETPAQRVARETSELAIPTLAESATAAQPGYESLYAGPSGPTSRPNTQTLASTEQWSQLSKTSPDAQEQSLATLAAARPGRIAPNATVLPSTPRAVSQRALRGRTGGYGI